MVPTPQIDASLSLMLGPPKRPVKAAGVCRPSPKLAWNPSATGARYADVYFASAPEGATAPQATALVLWVLYGGTLDPPIASVQLLVRPLEARSGSNPQPVTVFSGRPGQLSGLLRCPGDSALPLAWTASSGMTRSRFRSAALVGVRIHVNNGSVAGPGAELPHIAAVGLQLSPPQQEAAAALEATALEATDE
ncbi:hypothetical protein GPECTOR_73g628 [Gonium pectorale]|uniref:Uncharacterized protein n=1 Tax=Gonium pectorale TaxID=33097 RepID=A0A150G2M9_GONPE|nr:hypothetical protein GPECTOR_73g628 [Gonium pectorale]|eukprot:KXZ44107.1 hypothetical protein GPECTOR_73g628 [Gonium pectorale]